jgi:hypothetical protein
LALVLAGFSTAASAARIPVDLPLPHDWHDPYPLDDEAANDARSIGALADGSIWVASRAGVFFKSKADSPWQSLTADSPLASAFAVAPDKDRVSLWIGAWNGLYRVTGGRAQRVAGVDAPVGAVGVSPSGAVLAGGPHGFFLVEGDRVTAADPGCTRYLATIGADRHGTWWLATQMGLFRWRDGQGSYVWPGLDRWSIAARDLTFDFRGSLWLATLGGLQVFEGTRLRRTVAPLEGLPSSDVRCLDFAPDGQLWCGTDRGIARYDGQDWSVRRGRRWLVHDEVRDIAFDRAGTAWIATAGGVSALSRTNLSLASKAAHFQTILEARHIRPPGIVEKCRLRIPGDLTSWAPMDDDNDGGYTALYLAMESYRYAVTGERAAQEAARRAFATLEFLQTVTGTPGFVARTVVPADWTEVHDPNETVSDPRWAEEQVRDPRHKRVPQRWRLSADGRWLWKGDTSSDEITAHMFGYYVFYEIAADPRDRERVRAQVCRIVDHLLDHGLVLADLDGRATRWGVWSPERLNGDPDWAMERGINSVEILSFLKLAHYVSGDERYHQAYRSLIEQHRYLRNVREAPNLNPAWRTHIDLELLAFAYPALLALETHRPWRAVYRASFERWHQAVRAAGIPFFEFLYARYAGPRQANLAGANRFLRDTALDLIRWDADNSRREDVRLHRRPEVEHWQTARWLPPSETGYSRTDQNPWLAVQGDGGRSEGDGVFWLLPYWMGRYFEFVPR